MKDLEIVKDCLKGEEKGFQAIYELFAPKMLSVCLRFFSSRDQAEDVLQDSFIIIFDKLAQYNQSGSLEGWIRKIVLNKCLLELKRQSRKLYLFEDFQDVHNDEIDEAGIELLSQDEINVLISELPYKSKVVFNLYAIEGMKHKEIAELLGISEGTSKSQLFDARMSLKRRINELVLIKSNHVA
jgi:RNA polymerase sigma factor (sigma-70 family)